MDGVEAHDVGNLLCVLMFIFLLVYYSYICLRFKQYDHAVSVRLAVLNVVAAVVCLLSAPLPFIPSGCDIFYNAVGTLYLGSQVLLFNNRVIFSFYQMRPGTQTVLKAVVLIILVDGTAATTTYLAVRARLTGTMSYDEYACYLVRIGTPQSSSGYSGIAVTLPMTVVVVGMAVIFIYAFTGFVEFKRSTGKKESLKTLYLALLSFGSSAINQVMNTMDQMNMLAGLSAFRQIQKVLDSIIALTLALMVHRNIVARASRTADVRRLSKAHVAKPLQQASVQRSVTVNAGHPCIPHEPADAVNKMSIQWR